MELITCELLKMYVGEERQDPAEWHGGYGPVVYLNAEERRRYEVHIFDGRLCNAAGHPLDTGDTENLLPGSGRAIYVLDQNGRLYCSSSPRHFKFHHSSFVAGAPVACAGEIEVVKGLLIYLDNASGHYQPSHAQLTETCDHLRRSGVDCQFMTGPLWGVKS